MLLVMKCHNLLGSLGRKLAADDPVRAAAFVRRCVRRHCARSTGVADSCLL
jgi:hypothetical protein